MKNDNLKCIKCHSDKIARYNANIDKDKIIQNALTCPDCQSVYSSFFGLLYLGSFSRDEMLSLIEISSFSNRFTTSDKSGNLMLHNHTGLDYPEWIQFIEDYTLSNHPEDVMKSFGLNELPTWFPNRLREHLSFSTILHNENLDQKKVLDIGAGSGFDSLKYHARGARVTAMEFNPILASVGKHNFPQIEWFGGSSYNIPFTSDYFDVVCANATLHHLLDIPQAFSEMLRVLKTGGKILTVSDTFTSSMTDERSEAAIFNSHEAVLTGLNEQAPSFDKFAETLIRYKDYIDVTFFTHTVYGIADYPRSWSFEEGLEILSQNRGYFAAIKVEKKSDVKIPYSEKYEDIITPYDYTISLSAPTVAAAKLANNIPNKYINLKVLDDNLPKFRLLNGWKLQTEKLAYRRMYKKGRLFFSSKSISKQNLHFYLHAPITGCSKLANISIYLNGQELKSFNINRGEWNSVKIDLPEINKEIINSSFEININSDSLQHNSNILEVSEFSISETTSIEIPPMTDIHKVFDKIAKEQGSFKILVDKSYSNNIEIINKIRKYNKPIKLIPYSAQKDFYSWIPNVYIDISYSDENEWAKIIDSHKPDLLLLRDISASTHTDQIYINTTQSDKTNILINNYLRV